MVTTIKKWGNTLALPIPGVLAKTLRLQVGSLVDVFLVEGKMIIKPVRERKISLSSMLKGITKNNRHSGRSCTGFAGREIFWFFRDGGKGMVP